MLITPGSANYQLMFKNPFYYDLVDYNGELHEGIHEPIISKHLYDQSREVMQRKSKPKTPQLKPYLYRGFFRCDESGCFISTETQKGNNYLRCTKLVSICTQKYVREEAIAVQVDRTIERVALEAAIADKLISGLEKHRDEAAKGQEKAIVQLRVELKATKKQINLLLDMRLNEQVSEPEYVSKKHILVIRRRN